MNLKQALTGAEPLMMSGKEFLDLNIPDPELLLDGDFKLSKGTITLVSGESGVGKTMFLLALGKMMAGAIWSLGGCCWGPDRSKVLFVDGEMVIAEIKDRIRAFDLDDFPHFTLLSKVLLDRKDVNPELNLNESEVRRLLTKTIFDENFEVVILDNLFSLFQEHNFNSYSAWAPVNRWLLKLRAHDVAVLLAHHVGKSGDQLGTASRLFNIDNSLVLTKRIPEDNEKCCCFAIEIQKQRGRGINLENKTFILRRIGGEYINDDWTVEGTINEQEKTMNRVLAQAAQLIVAGEKTEEQIGKALDVSQPTVNRYKGQLKSKGLIVMVSHKKYGLTESGKEFVEKNG